MKIRQSITAAVAASCLLLAGCGSENSGQAVSPSSAAIGGSSAAVSSGPADSSPADSSPAESSPADSSPAESSPADSSPADSSPAESSPAESSPAESSPAESSPAESSPAESSPAELSTAGSSAPAGGGDVDPATFAKNLEAGMKTVTSLTADLESGAGGMAGKGKVSQQVTNGMLTAADMTIAMQGQEMTIRIVDGSVYFGGAMVAALAPQAAGKKWVKLDEASSNAGIKTLAKTLAPIMSNAGTDSYVYMARGIQSIKSLGPETVGAFQTTKYQVVIDVAKMVETLPPSMAEYGTLIKQSGLKTMESTYWIDDQNRLVKTSAESEVSGIKSSNTLTVTAFNEPVDIAAPAAADVYTG